MPPHRFRLALCALILLAALLRLLPLAGPIAALDGRTLADDTWLAATVARSIGWGDGPTYSGEPTNGIQPLHVLLTSLSWVGDPVSVQVAPSDELLDGRIKQALAVSVAFDLVSLVLLAALLGARYGPSWATLLGVAIWALHPTFVRVALNGLETSIAACLVLAALLLWERRARAGGLRWSAALGAVLGLAVLARIDALILVACLGAVEAWDARAGRQRWSRVVRKGAVVCGVAALVVLPYLVWSYRWTGLLFPISGTAVRLNALSWKERVGMGSLFWLRSFGSCLGSIVWHNGPALFGGALVALGLAWRRRGTAWGRAVLDDLATWRLALLFVGALLAAYSLWVLAWWFNHRYMFLAVLLPIAVLSATVAHMDPLRGRQLALGVALLCLLHPLRWGVLSGEPDLSRGYKPIATWAQENIVPSTRVGSCQTGALGYYATQLDVVNLDGVVSRRALTALQDGRAIEQAQEAGVQMLVAWPGCVRYLRQRSGPGVGDAITALSRVDGFQSWRRTWWTWRLAPGDPPER